MGKVEHLKYHSEMLKEKWKNEDFRKMQSEKARERMIKLNNNPTEKMKKARKERYKIFNKILENSWKSGKTK